MGISVNSLQNFSYLNSSSESRNTGFNKVQAFTGNPKNKDKNPISKTGEKANLLKATFLGGLALGGRLLWEICEWGDTDFLGNHIAEKSSKFIRKDIHKMSMPKQILIAIGAAVGLLAAVVTGFALIYTAANAPKIAYKGKLNAFTKGKDMDVYIKGNKAEKELYTQIADKARNASNEEKEELAKQYMQMRAAKNKFPDFIK